MHDQPWTYCQYASVYWLSRVRFQRRGRGGDFLHCLLFTLVLAPYFKKYGKKPGFIAIVNGITAAAIGKIIGAIAVIAQRSITDGIAAAISILSAVTQWKLQAKLPGPIIVAAAAVVGLVIYQLDH